MYVQEQENVARATKHSSDGRGNATIVKMRGTVGTLERFLGKYASFPECLRVPNGTVEANAGA